jgi:hypothetical protein
MNVRRDKSVRLGTDTLALLARLCRKVKRFLLSYPG